MFAEKLICRERLREVTRRQTTELRFVRDPRGKFTSFDLRPIHIPGQHQR